MSDVTVFATPKMSKKTSELFKLFHARSFELLLRSNLVSLINLAINLDFLLRQLTLTAVEMTQSHLVS